MLTKIKISFERENMQAEYSVYTGYTQDIYRIDLFCHGYKLTIEIDENGRSDRNIDYQRKRQKSWL